MVTQNLKKFDTPVFPFTAIVGQDEMKLALLLNVPLFAWKPNDIV